VKRGWTDQEYYKRPRIYVAGPISKGDTQANVSARIKAGMELLDLGYAPFIPHLSHLIDSAAVVGTEDYERWLALDLSYIQVCDAVLRLPGESSGADRECDFARRIDVPIFTDVMALQQAIFSKGDPRFHGALVRMGRLHDRKQADYGQSHDPFANVRGSADWGIAPWVGAMVRANDKLRRLQKYAKEGKLANESAEDSFLDLAVYAIIAYVLHKEEKTGD
jgi:hypothetical protein